MPVGKEIGKFDGKFTSVRQCAVNGEEGIVEGSYTAKVSGELKGTAVGTLTFTGLNSRGTISDLGTGYLDAGEAVPYKGHGVYWSGKHGAWETRAGVVMGDQVFVAEGQITLADGVFSFSGKLFELN